MTTKSELEETLAATEQRLGRAMQKIGNLKADLATNTIEVVQPADIPPDLSGVVADLELTLKKQSQDLIAAAKEIRQLKADNAELVKTVRAYTMRDRRVDPLRVRVAELEAQIDVMKRERG